MNDERRYDTASMADRLDRSREWLRQKVKAGLIPPPIKDESGRNFWLASDLHQILEKQAAGRDERLKEQAAA